MTEENLKAGPRALVEKGVDAFPRLVFPETGQESLTRLV